MPSALGVATSAERLLGPAATVVRRRTTSSNTTIARRALMQSVCEQRAVRAGAQLRVNRTQPTTQTRRFFGALEPSEGGDSAGACDPRSHRSEAGVDLLRQALGEARLHQIRERSFRDRRVSEV